MPATPSFRSRRGSRPTTTQGGKIVGYGDGQHRRRAARYDRHLYMDNAGHIIFGVYPGGVRTVTRPKTYNDGAWHQIVATLDSTKGMVLYVDGKKVGRGRRRRRVPSPTRGTGGSAATTSTGGPTSRAATTSAARSTTWRSTRRRSTCPGSSSTTSTVGAASTCRRPRPTPTARPCSPTPRTSTGGSAMPSGPTAKDSSGNRSTTSYSGGDTFGQPGAVTGTSDTAVLFDGRPGTVGSADQETGPTTYSEELWFKTTHHARRQADRLRRSAQRSTAATTTDTSTWRTPAS